MTSTKQLIKQLTLGATIGSAMVLTTTANAQFNSHKVSIYSQIDLSTFGSSQGNDCWGYVSPSGREYALMGLDNKVGFVEITDPANPDWFASINHSSSTWCDIKVYEDVAYIVTEERTGIQVIDLVDIDNHNINLVRTINSPRRSHNIALDETSGFLYTCGSRDGSATTVIFDLSNPTNPVEVGTWPSNYEHDVQVKTFTSGPNAGRQLMFGAGTGDGLDIVDVTNKSNVFHVSTTPYASVAYCHQVWTEDGQHLYINDELDNLPRTTVIDISDVNNPFVAGEFTSGLGAIDHNLYVKNGFLFAANYKSGLRVFDVGSDPVNPIEVGFFDTYPGSDGDGFDGAWSNFPYFPSGNVIVSDRARGLFVLDPSEAVGAGNQADAPLTEVRRTLGLLVSGGVHQLMASDDAYYILQSGPGFSPQEPHPAGADFVFDSAGFPASTLDITLEEKANIGGPTAVVELRNRVTSSWDEIARHALTPADQTFVMAGIPAPDYIGGGGNIKVRVRSFAVLILDPTVRGIFNHDFIAVTMQE